MPEPSAWSTMLRFVLMGLWGGMLVAGIRIICVARPGVDPERLKKVAGVDHLRSAQVGGWIAAILGGLMLVVAVMACLRA